jgi:hypothetical protein
MIYPCACEIFLHVFRNIIMMFLVPLLGSINPSDDAKKHQQVVTTVTGVHRRGEGGAPPGHRLWEGGATAIF